MGLCLARVRVDLRRMIEGRRTGEIETVVMRAALRDNLEGAPERFEK